MHLKNFSLYAPDRATYRLTPAYDMLNTLLIMPEDKEELPLTLNGKKSKLKRKDFMQAMIGSGVDEKAANTLLNGFEKYKTAWQQMIDRSFVSENSKEGYKQMLEERLDQLQLK